MIRPIRKVVGLVLPLARKKGLTLHAQVSPGLDRIVGDRPTLP